MKKNNKLKMIVTVLSMAICVSCNESFLDTKDYKSVNQGNYPSTIAHIDQLLNGTYATLKSNGLFGQNILTKGIYAWDHTQDMAFLGQPLWTALSQNNTSPIDGFLFDIWNSLWAGVQKSNTLLAGVESFRAKYATPNQLEYLKFVEGEAYFLRAWYYYYLVNIWGESFIADGQGGDRLGVPIVSSVPANLAATVRSRNTVAEVWAFIIDDLKKAEGLLAGKTFTGATDKHRAGIWAVKAFLGKAYVFTEQWPLAETTLKDVIDNSGKSLVSFNVYKDMFLGNSANEFNSESLFEINLNAQLGGPAAGNNNNTPGSVHGNLIAATWLNADRGKSTAGFANVFPHDKNLVRFGFKEAVPTTPTPAPPAADINVNYIPAHVATSKTLRDTKAVDPRLWISCRQPFLDSILIKSSATDAGIRRAIAHYNGIPKALHGWSFLKYGSLSGPEFTVNGRNNPSNILWLRLADVYLLYAETLIERGKNAEALEYINKVKRRAYDLPVSSASTRDYTSLSASTMASDPVLANNPLRYERWAELFAEGSWWFDVCRWRIGLAEATYYQTINGNNPIQWQDTDYAQPIPLLELQANPAMQPNQGY